MANYVRSYKPGDTLYGGNIPFDGYTPSERAEAERAALVENYRRVLAGEPTTRPIEQLPENLRKLYAVEQRRRADASFEWPPQHTSVAAYVKCLIVGCPTGTSDLYATVRAGPSNTTFTVLVDSILLDTHRRSSSPINSTALLLVPSPLEASANELKANYVYITLPYASAVAWPRNEVFNRMGEKYYP